MSESTREKLHAAFEAVREEGREEGKQKGREEGVALAVNILAPSDDVSPIDINDSNATAAVKSLAHQVCT